MPKTVAGYVEEIDFELGMTGLVSHLDGERSGKMYWWASIPTTSCSLCGHEYLVGQEIDVLSRNHTDCDYGEAYEEAFDLRSEYVD